MMSVSRVGRYLVNLAVWLAIAAPVHAATVTVAWDLNPEPDVTNYNVYVRPANGSYGSAIAIGKRTNWTFLNLQDNTQYYFAVQAQSPSGLSALSEIGYVTLSVNPPGSEPSRSDFNGDGWFDVLWQNGATGNVSAWHLNGTYVAWGRPLSPNNLAPAWRMSGCADFNRDGKPDIMWHNQQTGQLMVWLMDGVFAYTSVNLEAVAPNWRIASIRDFNGDGNPDLWWHNSATGDMVVWYYNGLTHVGTATPSPSRVADLNWKLRGSADFTGDGQPDVLWHNTATGQLIIWGLNGITQVSQPAVNPGIVGAGWTAAAVGDADQNGWPDILWQNDTNGGLVLWKMAGTSWIPGAASYLSYPAVSDLNWKIMAPR